jgi:prepilin-type N-terminal cleavage/methylation domain-containing protein
VRRGFTVVELIMAVSIALVIAAVCMTDFIRGRKHEMEAGAIGALKTVSTAESIFHECDKEHDGNLDYGMLSELDAMNLVDPLLGAGRKRGYFFEATYSYTTSEFLWFGVANPTRPGVTGDRSFDVNQAGVIFYPSGGGRLELDTGSCWLPRSGHIPAVGK